MTLSMMTLSIKTPNLMTSNILKLIITTDSVFMLSINTHHTGIQHAETDNKDSIMTLNIMELA
jgi:hypothetical protein